MSAVYAHLDAAGDVLYIGCTSFPKRRTEQHHGSAWWSQVAQVVIVASDLPIHKGRDLERRLIETFEPPHNVAHTRAWRERQRPEWARERAS